MMQQLRLTIIKYVRLGKLTKLTTSPWTPLGRLQQEADKKRGAQEQGPVRGYLDSHPVTAERIKRFMGKGG